MKRAACIIGAGLVPICLAGCASAPAEPSSTAGKYNFFLGAPDQKKPEDIKAEAGENLSRLDGPALHTRAQQALQQGDFDLALFYYVKVLEQSPKDAEAFAAIAGIHDQRGNYSLSTSAYRVLLSLQPDNRDTMDKLALDLIKLNRPEEAEPLFHKVLTTDADDVRAVIGLAICSDMRGDYRAAKEFYDHALTLMPTSRQALNNYAYSRYLAGDWDQAEKLYKQLLHLYPDHPQGWLNFGLLQARRGELNEAMESLKHVLPEAQAYNEVGYVYLLDQKYQEAQRLFQLAISRSPTYFERANKNLQEVTALLVRQERGAGGPAARIEGMPTGISAQDTANP